MKTFSVKSDLRNSAELELHVMSVCTNALNMLPAHNRKLSVLSYLVSRFTTEVSGIDVEFVEPKNDGVDAEIKVSDPKKPDSQ